MKKTKEHAKGVPYGKLKNWFNRVTSSSPAEAAKKADIKKRKKKKKNWDFSDASLKNL